MHIPFSAGKRVIAYPNKNRGAHGVSPLTLASFPYLIDSPPLKGWDIYFSMSVTLAAKYLLAIHVGKKEKTRISPRLFQYDDKFAVVVLLWVLQVKNFLGGQSG